MADQPAEQKKLTTELLEAKARIKELEAELKARNKERDDAERRWEDCQTRLHRIYEMSTYQ